MNRFVPIFPNVEPPAPVTFNKYPLKHFTMKHVFTLCLFFFTAKLFAQPPAMYTVDNWENSAWVPDSRTTNTLDAAGNVTYSLRETRQGGSWTNLSDNTHTYDSDGNLIAMVLRGWDQGGQQWLNVNQTLLTYDVNGVLVSSDLNTWSGSSWENEAHTVFSYDNDGNKILEVQESWNGSSFVNAMLTDYSYDMDGNLVEVINSTWNDQSSDWDPVFRRTYSYLPSGKVEEDHLFTYENNAWVNLSRQVYTYDAGDVLLYSLYADWGASGWQTPTRYEYTFNPDGTLQEQVVKYFDEYLNFWINDYRILFAYPAELGMEEHSDGLAGVSPNPAVDQLHIAFETEMAGELVLTDLSGQTVLEEIFSGKEHSTAIEELPAGVYVLKIVCGGQTSTRKIIKS
jgi:hypothetical protein